MLNVIIGYEGGIQFDGYVVIGAAHLSGSCCSKTFRLV